MRDVLLLGEKRKSERARAFVFSNKIYRPCLKRKFRLGCNRQFGCNSIRLVTVSMYECGGSRFGYMYIVIFLAIKYTRVFVYLPRMKLAGGKIIYHRNCNI